jgi:hypothetical protein
MIGKNISPCSPHSVSVEKRSIHTCFSPHSLVYFIFELFSPSWPKGDMNPKKDSTEERRDVSPSAYSQSSTGLEWDPSADVGSSNMIQIGLTPNPPTSTSTNSIDEDSEQENEGNIIEIGAGLVPTRRTPPPKSTQNSGKSTSEKEDDEGMMSQAFGTSSRGQERNSHSEAEEPEEPSSGRSTSMIFVAVQHNFDTKSAPPPEGIDEIVNVKNVGIQTSETHTTISGEISGELSSIYHSTPTDQNLQKGRFSKYRSSDELPMTSHRRKTRSPPAPFAVASRRSSHRHHDANHSRNNDTEHSSLTDSNRKNSSQRPIAAATSSSELSPPCFLVDKLTNTSKSPKKKVDIVDAIEIHRNYHIKKVRHELRQLDKLNQ